MPEAEAALASPDSDIAADLALLKAAASEGGRIALRYFRKNPESWMKAGDSPVSEADIAVDAYLKTALVAARPDYGWLSEETVDDTARLSRRRTFVVDPIDGTRAFIKGDDIWCVSVAVVEAGRAIAGVIDCPAKGEVFWAAEGQGAFRDGARLAVGAMSDEPAIGGPKPMIDMLPDGLRQRVRHQRYLPSLAYRLALVADGGLDATFVKPNAHDWDIAAASVILAEAGGAILGEDGRAPAIAGADPKHGALAAGHGALLGDLARVIARP